MAKANGKAKFFTKRGETTITFNFEDEEIEATIIIPTNYQNDKLVEEFTSVECNGSMDIRGSDLLESRLINFVKELSFDVPLDENLEEYGSWSATDEAQKRTAIRIMDPDLRDMINEKLLGKSNLSEEVVGN